MKIHQVKAPGETFTPEAEDKLVKAVVGEAANCDKCHEPSAQLQGRMVFIEGQGLHLVRICTKCFEEIKIATDKKMAEIRAEKAVSKN